MTISAFATLIGTVGVIIVLIAYLLLQAQKMNPYSFLYSFMNLLGSIMLLFSLYYDWNFPAVFIEVVWAMISIYGIYNALVTRSKLKRPNGQPKMDVCG
jgi:hypothetical protein